MTEHLTSATLALFADGELPPEQLADVNKHLLICQVCTANALSEVLLKSTVTRAGRRYAMPEEMLGRLLHNVVREIPDIAPLQADNVSLEEVRRAEKFGFFASGVAAALLFFSIGVMSFQRVSIVRGNETALVTEVCDQHIGTLAATQEPQVASTDRHTVKPWFQGKLPFTFNLPEGLPEDTTLDGANLTYLHNQPVAQLLYSIGKHRVSVFVRENFDGVGQEEKVVDHSGFHIASENTSELEFVAVSDVEPTKLQGLVATIVQVQIKAYR